MQKAELTIPFQLRGKEYALKIYGSSKNAILFEEEDACELGEARWQLVEGEEYEYEFDGDFRFAVHELVRPSKSNHSRGIIKTGIYVGCLTLKVLNDASDEMEVSFEVRSVKMGYREDYKNMLHDITCHFTELVMMQGAPVTQRFEVDVNEDGKTLYQQFAFLKSLIESEDFEEALNKILYNPIRRWTGTSVEKDICAVRRLGRNELRQVASGSNRLPLDADMRIGKGIDSVPRRLTIPYKIPQMWQKTVS